MTVKPAIAATWMGTGVGQTRQTVQTNSKADSNPKTDADTKTASLKSENNNKISTDREAKSNEPIAQKEKPDPIRKDDDQAKTDRSSEDIKRSEAIADLTSVLAVILPVPDHVENALEAQSNAVSKQSDEAVQAVVAASTTQSTDRASDATGVQTGKSAQAATGSGATQSTSDAESTSGEFETELNKVAQGTKIVSDEASEELNITNVTGTTDDAVQASTTLETKASATKTDDQKAENNKSTGTKNQNSESDNNLKTDNGTNQSGQGSTGQRGGGGESGGGKSSSSTGHGLMQKGSKQSSSTNGNGNTANANKAKGGNTNKPTDSGDSKRTTAATAADIKEWVTRNIHEKDSETFKVDETERGPSHDTPLTGGAAYTEPAEPTQTTDSPIPINESTTQKVQNPVTTNQKIDTADIQKQLVDRIDKMLENRRAGRMVIHMEPRELGSLTVTIRTLGQKVDMDILASNDQVRENLKSNANQLHQHVESRGYTVNSLDIQSSLADANQSHQGPNHEMMNRQDFERVQQFNAAVTSNTAAVSANVSAAWSPGEGVDLVI